MKKKIFFLLMAAITLLSGCGENSDARIISSPSQETNNHDSDIGEKEMESSETRKQAQPEMKGKITISTMIEEEFLKTAAEKFEKIYPDITVTINAYQGSSAENAADNYRTLLNTKIMSGKAEDIIFSTQLPLDKYMKMGVFEDLSDYISGTPEMNDENYFMNVLEAAKDENGKLFILPYVCSFQVISFDNRIAAESERNNASAENIRFSEAFDYAKEMTEETQQNNAYIWQGKKINYLENMVKEHQYTLVDLKEKKVNIDTEQYVEWLEKAKELGLGEHDIDYYNSEYYFAMIPDYDVQAAFFNLDGGSVMGKPIADGKGNVYTNSAYCFGLNSASENKDIAWEFMKYLLSEEIQILPSIHGLAVNKKGFEASADRYFKFYKDGIGSSADAEDYKSLLMQWVKEINSCDVFDPVITDYFNEENSKYFDGTQSAKQTAQILQSKITQYLGE